MKGTLGALGHILGPDLAGSVGTALSSKTERIGTGNFVGFTLDNSGSLVGTVVVEISVDGGATWSIYKFASDPFPTYSFTAFPVCGKIRRVSRNQLVRLRVSAYTSGSTIATLENLDEEF